MFSSVLSRVLAAGPLKLTLAGAALGLTLSSHIADASSDAVQPPNYPWSHSGWLSAFDHASIKRGYQVYREICSSCHSLNRIAFRNLVGVIFTEDEAKAIAAEYEVTDGPNDEGEMFQRPGKLSDYFPAPYANEQAARSANGGAYPPDLSLIVKGRPRHEDYVFALLTGYTDAPAGVSLRAGLHYNPYFSGGAIGMAQPLYDGSIEYEDGTPNHLSQLAKDVATFLAWASEPEHDDRKRMGFQWIAVLSVMAAFTYYYKRFRWSVIKNRRIEYHRK